MLKTHQFVFFYMLSSLFILTTSCRKIKKAPEITDITVESPIISNNISNQKISAFAEDAQGHIWIGTFRGLNKYNVHEYHQYFCTDDSLDLPDNLIQDVFKDSQGRLWIATVNGVCRYTDQDHFKHIPIAFPNKNGVQFFENKAGKIFLNMVVQLCVYNPEKDCFECPIKILDPQRTFNGRCFIDKNDQLWVVNPLGLRCYDSSTLLLKDSIPVSGYPTYSYLDENGELWLCGNQFLSLFDTHRQRYIHIPEVIRNHPILSKSTIEYIHPYGNQNLLINTAENGMFLYNPVKAMIVHQSENGFPFEVPHFKISKMFTDSQKNLWIGSIDQGYVVRYNYKERFNNNNYLRDCVKNKSVVSMAVDKGKHLWIATLMDGLYLYDLQSQKVRKIDMRTVIPKEKQRNMRITQVYVDTNNNLWLVTLPQKLLKCHYLNGKLQKEKEYIVHYPITMAQDHNQTIWVGTASESVASLRKGKRTFQSQRIYPILYTFIPDILPLRSGKILVAAFKHKLVEIDPDTGNYKTIELPEKDIRNCIRRSVFIPTVLYEDTQGKVWIGTVSNGLLIYSPAEKRLRPVSGIPCADISSIEEDIQGNMWISTQYGLSKYDRAVHKFTNYYAADGIGGNQFYDRASCRLPDGTLVFGGTHGLTFFNPINVTVKRNIPLLFEDLKIHNKLIQPSDDQCINKHLSYKPDIRLKHNQNSFSISFAALDYCEHERVHYYYKMEHFDNYWIDAYNNREAYYANLPPGKYCFKVKITNNDKSIIEAENSIQVIILPEPWNTIWAYSIYFIVTITIIALFFRTRLRIKAEKEAIKHAEQQRLQEKQVNKMNMSFFANVSHEFRTPLTMISGPIKLLGEDSNMTDHNKTLLHIIQHSVDRMLKLINQLMDFNKLENDTLKLKVKHADIISVLTRLTDIFRVNAQNKGITLKTYILEETFLLWLDEDKLDKIFGNLLSNALKFTPDGGKIDIYFDVINREEASQIFNLTEKDKDTQYIKISVADTGKGIPLDKQEKVFERYFQLDDQKEGIYNWGTGIGLYYARSLTELHHGHIKVENRQDSTGAIFTFILPINDISYTEEERVTIQNSQKEAFPLLENGIYQTREAMGNQKKRQAILLVDDDTEVVHYLNVLLSPYYRIICRFDAGSAFKAVNEEAPDLVLSDIVMPGKDGYQLCKMIKENLQICHIPVILLTAKVTMENQVKGLNTGADAYVTKPFDPNYLLALIKSQLENRERVRNLLSQTTKADKIGENMLSPQDNAFMTDLYKLMENELSNPELDVARMSEWLKISRTKFYYKVKGLTGENPSIFFKTYKLNRAAELIAEGKYNISEIADMTGFATLSHFSTSFKKKFGVTPSQYYK